MAAKSSKQQNSGSNVHASLKSISGFVKADQEGDYHRLLNDRVRLGIVSSLAVSNKLTFNDLKHLLEVTDGNLSVHARKLEEAGYISINKSFDGRMPKTEFSIRQKGRKTLQRYLKHMEALIRATTN
ncbi:MAG: transcriptional regulator [Gammaproteobacteria bacterium]|nr:transcriptional regulator [Gammaproteobacteria bacterium]